MRNNGKIEQSHSPSSLNVKDLGLQPDQENRLNKEDSFEEEEMLTAEDLGLKFRLSPDTVKAIEKPCPDDPLLIIQYCDSDQNLFNGFQGGLDQVKRDVCRILQGANGHKLEDSVFRFNTWSDYSGARDALNNEMPALFYTIGNRKFYEVGNGNRQIQPYPDAMTIPTVTIKTITERGDRSYYGIFEAFPFFKV